MEDRPLAYASLTISVARIFVNWNSVVTNRKHVMNKVPSHDYLPSQETSSFVPF